MNCIQDTPDNAFSRLIGEFIHSRFQVAVYPRSHRFDGKYQNLSTLGVHPSDPTSNSSHRSREGGREAGKEAGKEVGKRKVGR